MKIIMVESQTDERSEHVKYFGPVTEAQFLKLCDSLDVDVPGWDDEFYLNLVEVESTVGLDKFLLDNC